VNWATTRPCQGEQVFRRALARSTATAVDQGGKPARRKDRVLEKSTSRGRTGPPPARISPNRKVEPEEGVVRLWPSVIVHPVRLAAVRPQLVARFMSKAWLASLDGAVSLGGQKGRRLICSGRPAAGPRIDSHQGLLEERRFGRLTHPPRRKSRTLVRVRRFLREAKRVAVRHTGMCCVGRKASDLRSLGGGVRTTWGCIVRAEERERV